MFTLIFITVFGLIIFTIIRGIGEWNKNNQSPRLTVEASIVAKRTHVSRHTHHNAGTCGLGNLSGKPCRCGSQCSNRQNKLSL